MGNETGHRCISLHQNPNTEEQVDVVVVVVVLVVVVVVVVVPVVIKENFMPLSSSCLPS